MAIIAIVGKADKRILAYPLMKTLALLGRTCVITDDVTYRRLYSGVEDTGVINDVEIDIVKNLGRGMEAATAAAILEEQKREEGFDYLLYLTDTYAPVSARKTIALCSPTQTFMGQDLEGLADEYPDLVFASVSITERPKRFWRVPVAQVLWKPDYVRYVCETEERRMLSPLKDRLVNQVLCEAFAESLGFTKDNFMKVMNRKLI